MHRSVPLSSSLFCLTNSKSPGARLHAGSQTRLPRENVSPNACNHSHLCCIASGRPRHGTSQFWADAQSAADELGSGTEGATGGPDASARTGVSAAPLPAGHSAVLQCGAIRWRPQVLLPGKTQAGASSRVSSIPGRRGPELRRLGGRAPRDSRQNAGGLLRPARRQEQKQENDTDTRSGG